MGRPFGASPIFIILTIMAQKNVFPIFLDDPIQEISAGSNNWNGATSRVFAKGTCSLEVGPGITAGTLLSIGNESGTTTINITDGVRPFGDDNSFDDITLSPDEVITLMWTGSEWFIMGATEVAVG